tara:strand:+ start:372 stop:2708 length:2337 start_codon:yes stop_codon:yes gene_type:complete
MARRLPKGTTFRGSYAPAPISYDKPQGDYTKIAALGEKALPLADKILTPTLFRLGRGAYNLVEGLFEDDEEIKEGAAGYQQKIKNTESSARQEVANKLLGNVPDVTLQKPDLIKDAPKPPAKKPGPITADRSTSLDYVTELLKKAGDRVGSPGYLKRYTALLDKLDGSDFPEDVLTNLQPEQIKRLVEDPSYYGRDLLEQKAVEPPDPMQRQVPAFDQFKDVRLDPAVSRAESVQQSRMNQIRGEIESEIDRLEKSNIFPRRQSYHDAIDLYNRGKIANIPDELLYLRDLKEREKLEEIAPQLEPAQRGVPEAKREADAQVEELYADVQSLTEQPKAETDAEVSTPEKAVEVIRKDPASRESVAMFERGNVQRLNNMPFSQVRAIASLSDPSRMSSSQVAALAARYRREEVPKSLTSLLSGDYLEDADKKFTKDFGRYRGFATGGERASAAQSRAANVREELKQDRQDERARQQRAADLREFNIQENRLTTKALSDIYLAGARRDQARAEAQLVRQKTKTEVQKARKLQLEVAKLARIFNRSGAGRRNRGRFIAENVGTRPALMYVVNHKGKNYRMDVADPRFQQLVYEGKIKLSKAERKEFNSHLKSVAKYNQDQAKTAVSRANAKAKAENNVFAAEQGLSSTLAVENQNLGGPVISIDVNNPKNPMTITKPDAYSNMSVGDQKAYDTRVAKSQQNLLEELQKVQTATAGLGTARGLSAQLELENRQKVAEVYAEERAEELDEALRDIMAGRPTKEERRKARKKANKKFSKNEDPDL